MTGRTTGIGAGIRSTLPVLGYELFNGDRDEFIRTLLHEAMSTLRGYRVGYLNAAQFNLGEKTPEFRALLESMDLLYADGQSIVWAARRTGTTLTSRLTATDFIAHFLERASASGISVALVGGERGSAQHFGDFWTREIQGLEVRYVHDGYFDEDEKTRILRSIEQSDADVVLVGMGAPLQERFAAEAAAHGGARVWWCVGALFEYGPWGKRRAPRWMRRSGLEWAFRLAQEPRRLAGRYLIGNPLFVWRALLWKRN